MNCNIATCRRIKAALLFIAHIPIHIQFLLHLSKCTFYSTTNDTIKMTKDQKFLWSFTIIRANWTFILEKKPNYSKLNHWLNVQTVIFNGENRTRISTPNTMTKHFMIAFKQWMTLNILDIFNVSFNNVFQLNWLGCL